MSFEISNSKLMNDQKDMVEGILKKPTIGGRRNRKNVCKVHSRRRKEIAEVSCWNILIEKTPVL